MGLGPPNIWDKKVPRLFWKLGAPQYQKHDYTPAKISPSLSSISQQKVHSVQPYWMTMALMESRTFYEMLAYIFQNRNVFWRNPMYSTLGSLKLVVAESISKEKYDPIKNIFYSMNKKN